MDAQRCRFRFATALGYRILLVVLAWAFSNGKATGTDVFECRTLSENYLTVSESSAATCGTTVTGLIDLCSGSGGLTGSITCEVTSGIRYMAFQPNLFIPVTWSTSVSHSEVSIYNLNRNRLTGYL